MGSTEWYNLHTFFTLLCSASLSSCKCHWTNPEPAICVNLKFCLFLSFEVLKLVIAVHIISIIPIYCAALIFTKGTIIYATVLHNQIFRVLRKKLTLTYADMWSTSLPASIFIYWLHNLSMTFTKEGPKLKYNAFHGPWLVLTCLFSYYLVI